MIVVANILLFLIILFCICFLLKRTLVMNKLDLWFCSNPTPVILPCCNGSQIIQFKTNTTPDELWQGQYYRLNHFEMDIATFDDIPGTGFPAGGAGTGSPPLLPRDYSPV
jgi:hypothetical protein